MLPNIHSETAQATNKPGLATRKPASHANRIIERETIRGRSKLFNEEKTKIKIESTPELTSKLNELAKKRPFNILYRVKKYDPL